MREAEEIWQMHQAAVSMGESGEFDHFYYNTYMIHLPSQATTTCISSSGNISLYIDIKINETPESHYEQRQYARGAGCPTTAPLTSVGGIPLLFNYQ